MPAFTSEEIRQGIFRNFGVMPESEDLPAYHGKTWDVRSDKGAHGIFIYVKDPRDISTFTHEAVHAAAYALPMRGFTFNCDQEAYSYTVAALVKYLYLGLK
jgi:hypothetical protein